MIEPARPALLQWAATVRPGSTLEPLAGDASTRRFFRLRSPRQASAVVMDYGAPFVGETDDVRLARVFEAAGLEVARVLEIVPDPGCLLLEDLGDRSLESEILAAGHASSAAAVWRERAVDLAARIAVDGTHALAVSDRAAGPALDAERFRFEMEFALEHYWGGHRGERPTAALRARLLELADRAAAVGPRVLCHRDFHSRNLMVVGPRLAMVDIQDARWGPLGYDLASLLCDAYVELDERQRAPLVERFVEAVPGAPHRAEFEVGLDLLCVERMVKMLGTFGYLTTRLGRTRYRDAIPRTLRRLAALGFPV